MSTTPNFPPVNYSSPPLNEGTLQGLTDEFTATLLLRSDSFDLVLHEHGALVLDECIEVEPGADGAYTIRRTRRTMTFSQAIDFLAGFVLEKIPKDKRPDASGVLNAQN